MIRRWLLWGGDVENFNGMSFNGVYKGERKEWNGINVIFFLLEEYRVWEIMFFWEVIGKLSLGDS